MHAVFINANLWISKVIGNQLWKCCHGTIGYKSSPVDPAVQEDELNLQMYLHL